MWKIHQAPDHHGQNAAVGNHGHHPVRILQQHLRERLHAGIKIRNGLPFREMDLLRMVIPVLAVFGVAAGDLLEIEGLPAAEVDLAQTVIELDLSVAADQFRCLPCPEFRTDKGHLAVHLLPDSRKSAAILHPLFPERRIRAPDEPTRVFRRQFSVTNQNQLFQIHIPILHASAANARAERNARCSAATRSDIFNSIFPVPQYG